MTCSFCPPSLEGQGCGCEVLPHISEKQTVLHVMGRGHLGLSVCMVEVDAKSSWGDMAVMQKENRTVASTFGKSLLNLPSLFSKFQAVLSRFLSLFSQYLLLGSI